jgi:hypothetical protein
MLLRGRAYGVERSEDNTGGTNIAEFRAFSPTANTLDPPVLGKAEQRAALAAPFSVMIAESLTSGNRIGTVFNRDEPVHQQAEEFEAIGA